MTKFKISLSLFIFCMALFLAAMPLSVPAADPLKIVVQQGEIVATGSAVYLRDIATITGGTPADRAALQNIFVSRAPSAGQHVRISETSLKAKIARANVSVNYILDTPPFIRISSESALLHSRDFIKAAEDYLKKQNLWVAGLKVSTASYQAPRNVSAGTRSFQCAIAGKTGETDPIRVTVTAQINGKETATQDVVFIRPGQTTWQKGPATQNEPGTPAVNSAVRIRKSDPVQIQFMRKNMVIVVEGNAAEAGSPGETIRVVTRDNKKVFNAVLQDASTATVEM